MIESIQFRNFKALRDTTLPLGPFTLIVGSNGSGKTTAALAVHALYNVNAFNRIAVASVGVEDAADVSVVVQWSSSDGRSQTRAIWSKDNTADVLYRDSRGARLTPELTTTLRERLSTYRIYTPETDAIAKRVSLEPKMELAPDGANLAGVLDRFRDDAPESWEAFNAALGEWFPEFDHVLFDTPTKGTRIFLLRTREGQHRIPARDLSQGTLFALTMLTLAYLPKPPAIVCFEEPDRGIHPRLLTSIRDALYRLAYPEDHGESRAPVQVIATTHSPYFLDLFKDHPEEIVIAEKTGQEARFHRLTDRSDLSELLGEASLGEIWYTGILGGVPAAP